MAAVDAVAIAEGAIVEEGSPVEEGSGDIVALPCWVMEIAPAPGT